METPLPCRLSPASCTTGPALVQTGGVNTKRTWRSVDNGPGFSSHSGMVPRWLLRGGSAGWSPRGPQQPPAHECTPCWLFSLPCLTFSTASLVLLGITSQINYLHPNPGLRICVEGTETKPPPSARLLPQASCLKPRLISWS